MPTFRRNHCACMIGALLVGAFTVLIAEDVPAANQDSSPIVTTRDEAAISVPANHAVFIQAISERRLLQFSYAGHVRVCEPHAYGVSSTGEAVLHTFQTAGSSGSRPPPGWRTFTVSGITDVVLTQRRFAKARSDFTEQRPALEPTWAELPAPVTPQEDKPVSLPTARTISATD